MNYYWTEDEFVTGDNLESLGNFTFDIENYIIGDHGRQKTNKLKQELIEEQINCINIQQPHFIYCYGHDTNHLHNNIDKINHRFNLITHNSDIGILPEYESLANNEKVIRWFGQNNYLNHSKTVSLPIGIARKKYPHGNTVLLSEASKNTVKTNLVYKNFSIDTNLYERTIVDRITSNNGIYMHHRVDHKEYLKNISQSVFVISPPGNGVDCHRIWECLYLKTIPIVKRHIAFKQFDHLPILFVDSWEEVTISMLESKIKMLDNFSSKIEELNFNHLKKRIQGITY